ncbi:MAG: replication initiation protein [Arcobacter sp.]|nr:replication initiation protein [Arcobacter sp.]
MTPRELRERKLKELEEQKFKPHQRISNNFINSAILDLNKNALKTVFYLSTILDDFNFKKDIDTLEIDLRKMFKHTGLTADIVKDNLKAMQKTSITFVNEKEEIEEFIVIIPRIEFLYGQNKVKIDIYSKIAKLFIDVKENYQYTPMNIKTILNLNNKHSFRLLPVLNMLSRYDDHVGKRKKYSLADINDMFGTNYKRFADIKRSILEPVKEELDNGSSLTFVYQINSEKLGAGRPKATSVTIDVVEKNHYQGRLL